MYGNLFYFSSYFIVATRDQISVSATIYTSVQPLSYVLTLACLPQAFLIVLAHLLASPSSSSLVYLCQLITMGEAVEFFHLNGFLSSKFDRHDEVLINNNVNGNINHEDIDGSGSWYEETIDDDLKWSFALNGFVNYIMTYLFNPRLLVIVIVFL